MENQSTTTSSPATRSSATPKRVSRPTSPSLLPFWLLIDLYIIIVLTGIAFVISEHIPIGITLSAIILVQPLLFLCSKSPRISATIIKRECQERVHIVRYAKRTQNYYTLPRHLSLFATSANVNDPSIGFGMFQLFILADPGGWVGFTSPKAFSSSSRGFFSRLVRGEDELAGRKVYEVELKQCREDNQDHAIRRITGRVVGEVLGVCEVGGRVVVSMEDWFVESDAWKMEVRMEEAVPPVDAKE